MSRKQDDMIFLENYKKDKVGVWYFFPKDEKAYSKGKPTMGFGAVKYAEGSVYVGDLYFDGKNYEKLGFGRQDFSLSTIGKFFPALAAKKAFFIGQYDYRKTEWIYGNGVLYFVDEFNQPKYFVKGHFEGLNKTKEWEGKFTKDDLAEGYDLSMEIEFDEPKAVFDYERSQYSNLEEIENVFLGDSYMEFFYYKEYSGSHIFAKEFDMSKNMDLGIGGQTYDSWRRFVTQLDTLPNVKRVFVNLGFNDLHFNQSIDEVAANRTIVLNQVKLLYPNAKIYLFSVVSSPAFPAYSEVEKQYNKNVEELVASDPRMEIIDVASILKNKQDEGMEAFHPDLIHPNENGYQVYLQLIKEKCK